MLEPGKLDKGIAGAEHQRHTYCVAEKGRLWRHIALQAQPDIAQTAKSVVGQQRLGITPGRRGGLHRFNGGQLSIDSAQVIQ
nr:Uncharacterised protein [Klebsiella pneumoniae]